MSSLGFLDVILVALILSFALFVRRSKDTDVAFDRSTTAAMRGLAMFAIILHHIRNRLSLPSVFLAPAGYLATGLFFFISGYGNTLSLKKLAEVKFGWFLKKVLKIYIPFIVSYCLYFIVLLATYPDLMPDGKSFIADAVTISMPNQVSWFPKIILLCFLLHWATTKVFKTQFLQNATLLGSMMLYMAIAHELGLQSYWYRSVLCYPVGCIISSPSCAKTLLCWFRKRSNVGLLVTAVGFIFTYLLFLKTNIISFSIVNTVLLSLACYYFSCLFIIRNKFFYFVGNNSFEFYLFHIVCLQVFSHFIGANNYIYTLLVFSGSFLLVVLYRFFRKKLSMTA